jgi:hypothetical protein
MAGYSFAAGDRFEEKLSFFRSVSSEKLVLPWLRKMRTSIANFGENWVQRKKRPDSNAFAARK